MKQTYPKYGRKEYSYEVVKAIRLHSPALVDKAVGKVVVRDSD